MVSDWGYTVVTVYKAYKLLYFIRRSTSNSHSFYTKLSLYKSLIWPKLLYCSQFWRPHRVKDINNFECVQRRATKFILQDYQSDYKLWLTTLNILPLSLWFEYLDFLFLLKCLQHPPDHFNIFNFIQFVSSNTHSSSASKLKRILPHSSQNCIHFFYFNRVVRIWNSLPVINLSLSASTIKLKIKAFLWEYFLTEFDPSRTCTWFLCCPCQQCCCKTKINFNQP